MSEVLPPLSAGETPTPLDVETLKEIAEAAGKVAPGEWWDDQLVDREMSGTSYDFRKVEAERGVVCDALNADYSLPSWSRKARRGPMRKENKNMTGRYPLPVGQSGPWKIEQFTASDVGSRMSMFREGSRAPRPGTYTRLMRNGKTIMSDTPAEIRDLYEFEREAHGSILMNGLGLAVAARMALAKPSVKDVTVIEQSADVIALVSPHVQDSRLTIIQGDAYEWQPPKGRRWNVVWHDIWDDICADNLPEMARLHRKYGRRADWQGSWCRWQCQRNARRAA